MAKKDEIEHPHFIDRHGNVILVGDTVVYGNSLGRCSKTAVGMVLRIYTVPDPWYKGPGRRAIHMRICSVQDDVGFASNGPYAKDVTISQSERVLKYPNNLLSHTTRLILERGEDKYRCSCNPAGGVHASWCKAPKRPK
jgi:hypothetical protein